MKSKATSIVDMLVIEGKSKFKSDSYHFLPSLIVESKFVQEKIADFPSSFFLQEITIMKNRAVSGTLSSL